MTTRTQFLLLPALLLVAFLAVLGLAQFFQVEPLGVDQAGEVEVWE